MKTKKLLTILILVSLICGLLAYLPSSQAIFSINPTVRNGSIYINDKKHPAAKIATFGGAAYIPLNLIAERIGIDYQANQDETTVSFTYQSNTLTLDFNTKSALLNGEKYELLHGTSRVTDATDKVYIFVGNQDIQNIFGIITQYDSSTYTVKINTGFGVVAVDYSQQGGYQSESNMANAKARLHTYANNIATKNKAYMTTIDKSAVSSVTEGIIRAINAPITKSELNNGIKIKGLASYDNISSKDLDSLMQIRFMSSLANIPVSSEYVRAYEISNYYGTAYVVGFFFTYEGLDMSDDSLVTAVIASLEDTLKATTPTEVQKSIATKVKTIVKELRTNNKIFVCYIQNNQIKAAGFI